MELAEVISYWRRLGEEKWKTAEALMEKERYADALFFVHLSLEAVMKEAAVRHTGKEAPYIHDLPRLAYLAGLELLEEQKNQLEAVTTFNVRGRYDDYKLSLYKKATREYTREHLKKANDLRLWIQSQKQ
ncbi:MAG: hypothetical protein A3C07_03005 [Candidatus Sungbacteria bacterium RIFCSPHIGHO2_02_FULL_47_11]|uniref:HEPN domain-containing protein n=1 Tax=Candidatus Sungbacteria bacterium RIFCSPHIGHO2_02_FULL_47_11 TaxID=1802270 RepID=A0A1G2KFZ8_9BACT|nr:MAG: hypothetical protein A3C07_03005 [Candidatus Sungbacteria bacterium RIFCSPHIGHO2_02_FULL_47_11]